MMPATAYDMVFLADDEWGSDTMERIAREWFETHPDCDFVEVHEHGGWWLGWHRSMICVGTANTQAVLKPDRPRPDHFSGTCHRRKSAAKAVLPFLAEIAREMDVPVEQLA